MNKKIILGMLAISCFSLKNSESYVGVEVGYYSGYPIGYYYDCSYPSCWYGWGYPNYAYAPYWGTYLYTPDYKYSLGYYNDQNQCSSKCYRDCRRTSGMSASQCRISCNKKCVGDADWQEIRHRKHHKYNKTCTTCEK